jgi:hypothetical protein
MARRLLESYIKLPKGIEGVDEDIKKALLERDDREFINILNSILSKLPYKYYKNCKRDEYFYCRTIFLLFHSIKIGLQAEVHSNLGRADFVISYGAQTWVIEVKVKKGQAKAQKLASEAFTQILEKNYGGGYKNPVLLGLVVDDRARIITTWMVKTGLDAEPETKQFEPQKTDNNEVPSPNP